MSQSNFFEHDCVWANLGWGETVNMCRRAKITWEKNNHVLVYTVAWCMPTPFKRSSKRKQTFKENYKQNVEIGTMMHQSEANWPRGFGYTCTMDIAKTSVQKRN